MKWSVNACLSDLSQCWSMLECVEECGITSVGRVPDWKAWRNTDAGLSPLCGKVCFPQNQPSVQTLTVSVLTRVWIPCAARYVFPRINLQCRLLRCPYSPRVQSHASTSVLTFKSQTLAAIPLFWHTKILHVLTAMGSAALEAVVPYPGKATRISRKFLFVTGGILFCRFAYPYTSAKKSFFIFLFV